MDRTRPSVTPGAAAAAVSVLPVAAAAFAANA